MQQFLSSMAAIVLTAVAGLVGAYIRDRLQYKRTDQGVRRQIAALLESSGIVLEVLCKTGDVSKAIPARRPLKLLLERLSQSDVSIAFKIEELSALMHVITMASPYLDLLESDPSADTVWDGEVMTHSPLVWNAIESARFWIGDRKTEPSEDEAPSSTINSPA